MLKPSDNVMPAPDDERPVGELVSELIDDGKAYARAEMNLAKTIATAKGKALSIPAALFVGALLLLQAGITALAVAIVVLLTPIIGPILAGIMALVIFGGAAGALAWFGMSKLREAL